MARFLVFLPPSSQLWVQHYTQKPWKHWPKISLLSCEESIRSYFWQLWPPTLFRGIERRGKKASNLMLRCKCIPSLIDLFTSVQHGHSRVSPLHTSPSLSGYSVRILITRETSVCFRVWGSSGTPTLQFTHFDTVFFFFSDRKCDFAHANTPTFHLVYIQGYNTSSPNSLRFVSVWMVLRQTSSVFFQRSIESTAT